MLEQKIKSLENNIKCNDSFLEMLFDTIPNPVFYKDKSGVYKHCNEAFSKTILGIQQKDIIGKTLYEFPELIPKKNADIYYSRDKELFDSPGTQYYEAKVKCSDSIERYYNFYKATHLSQSNDVLGIVGVMLDISSYKNTQIELEEKNTILNELSITDPLTDLYNRRYFDEILEKKILMLNAKRQKFAFMIIDIDYFKDFNDSFGHHNGDKALETISKLIKGIFFRSSDYVFRLGGEEFGILFTYHINEQAVELAQHLILMVEDLKVEAGLDRVSSYVTISGGLGLLEYSESEFEESKKLFSKVDKLLYESKQNGRNQLTHETITQ